MFIKTNRQIEFNINHSPGGPPGEWGQKFFIIFHIDYSKENKRFEPAGGEGKRGVNKYKKG
ncbi:MAG: hypothetical protein QG665_111 [Patescibacteria group bacterium]|nr:hypothetical protein [Patescibacteria group bacterium]